MARAKAQRCEHRQGQGGKTQLHQRVVDDEVEPVELDAPPMDGDAVELLVSLPLVLPVALPETLPVPVAPIELVPLEEVLGVVSVLALPVVVPLLLIEPVVLEGDVDAVDEVEGGDPGVVVVVVEAVLDSRFVQAPSDMAATTASTPAVIWVSVIFIRNSL